MSISNEEYGKMTKRLSPPSPVLKDCLMAFIFGGAICAVAQCLLIWFKSTAMTLEESKALTTITIIAVTAILTATGLFDKIAKIAGAGTAVPITGFANSIVSAALEFQTEGRVLGTAAQMFSLAGPVIVFGCTSASIYGLIVYIFSLY